MPFSNCWIACATTRTYAASAIVLHFIWITIQFERNASRMGNTSQRAGNMIGIADDVKMYQCIRLITLMLNLFTIISWLRFSVRFHHCLVPFTWDIALLNLTSTPHVYAEPWPQIWPPIKLELKYVENQSVPCKTSTKIIAESSWITRMKIRCQLHTVFSHWFIIL